MGQRHSLCDGEMEERKQCKANCFSSGCFMCLSLYEIHLTFFACVLPVVNSVIVDIIQDIMYRE